MRSRWAILAALVAGVIATGRATASVWDNEYTKGHADLGVAVEDGNFFLHIHLEGGTVNGVSGLSEEFAADEIYTRVPDSTLENRPAGSQYDFIGVAAGQPFYKLPQSGIEANLEQAPYLGLGSEEIESGVLVGDQFTFSLTSIVSAPLDGYFSLFSTGPTPVLDSFGTNSFVFPTGLHEHFNWGFTKPGIYEIEFTATGTLVDGNTPITNSAVYTFVVGSATAVPEASSLLMASSVGLIGVFGAWRRRRAAR